MAYKHIVVPTHPDTARDILKNLDTFIKKDLFNTFLVQMTENSLVNTNHDQWKHQRSTMSPAFLFEYLKGLVPIFIQKTDIVLHKFPKAEEFDLNPWLYKWTVDVLAKSSFGLDFEALDGETNQYYKAYTELSHHQRACLQSITSLLKEHMPFLPYTKKLLEAQKKMKEMAHQIIKLHKNRSDKEKIYLIDMMLTAEPPLPQQEVETNIFLFFLAGHETTSSALGWAFYFLARYPDIQSRLQEEVDRVLGGKHAEPHQLKDLVYLDMFIKEVLRYGSPGSVVPTRITAKDVYLDNYFIPKGTPIGVAIHAIHHNPEFWPNPEVFDPERFSPDRIDHQHPFAFLPFSLGKRVCIGNNFSLLEQKVFISMTLQKYSVAKTDDKNSLVLDPLSLTACPASVKITLNRRGSVQ